MNTAQNLKALTKDLTLKEANFWNYYFASGNGTQSALKAYDTTDPVTAATIAYQNFRKHQELKVAYMEMTGLSFGKLTEKLKEGLEATKTSNAAILLQQDGKTVKAEEQGLIEVPDYATRHRYVETAAKWLGIQKEDILSVEGGGNQFNFFGLTYDQITAITDKTGTSRLRDQEFTDVLLEGSIRSEQQEQVVELHSNQISSEDTETEDLRESPSTI